MPKLVSLIFCFLLVSAFVKFAEAKPGVTINLIDRTPANRTNVRDDEEKAAVAETTRIVAEIVNTDYPELRNIQIKVKTFDSRSDYFHSRFSFSRFLTFRKFHFLLFVNPKVFRDGAPSEGIRAIIAHELAHLVYYRRHNRFELFGLVSLQSKSFTARFERGTDLQAIKRGYGIGLKQYRQWLYKNIPAKKIAAKKRDYFSPEEIDLILEAVKQKPDLIDFWIKKVPRNLSEIQKTVEKLLKPETE